MPSKKLNSKHSNRKTSIRTMLLGRYSLVLMLFLKGFKTTAWGFFAHKKINEIAIFSLPEQMVTFYKPYLAFIKERAVNPDKRRYVIEGEAPRHYIDMEYYTQDVPCQWFKIIEYYTQEELSTHGILPWHIIHSMHRLTAAFKKGDVIQILKQSADLGHYVADACVPLHTTQNYDGQYTDQKGIHGLWESRLPELFASEYNLFVGRASYIDKVEKIIWNLVQGSYSLVSSVLSVEKKIDTTFPSYKKYCFEKRGASVRKMYSQAYAKMYHQALAGMVEARMRKAIFMVASVWYTCWVNAGQPSLPSCYDQKLVNQKLAQEKMPTKKLSHVRTCEH